MRPANCGPQSASKADTFTTNFLFSSGEALENRNPCSLGEHLLVEVVHKVVLVVVADGHRMVALEDDMIFLHFDDPVEVDDEGTVDAHELAGGEVLLDFFHAQQHDDGLIPVVA